MSKSTSKALETLEKRRLLSSPPSIYIGDVSVEEGTGGAQNAAIVVSLSHPRPKQTVKVSYGTQNGSAVAGSDYTAKSGTLSFAPGEDSKTILVPITGDSITES